MSPHVRAVHEVFYWTEVALAPFACWLVWIVTKALWRRGWLGDEWPDPQADVDADDDESLSWVCPYCPRTVLIADDESELDTMVESHEARIHATGPGLVRR